MKYQLITRRASTDERPGVYVVRAIDGKNELPPSPPYGYKGTALLNVFSSSKTATPRPPYNDKTLADALKNAGIVVEEVDETAKYA